VDVGAQGERVKAIQDHFLEVSVLVLRYLALVLVLNGGLARDKDYHLTPRPCFIANM